MKKAIYIAFEGVDGSGKTTQLNLLEQFLIKQGNKVLTTKEIGSPHNEFCKELRKLILNDKYQLDDVAAQFALAAGSSQHSEKVIKPNLYKYDFILSDRSIESNLAYCDQGLWNLNESFAFQLFFLDTRRVFPDKIIYLDTDPKKGLQRTNQRQDEFKNQKDRIESKGTNFQQRVRERFLRRAEENNNYILIPFDEIQAVHQSIINKLDL